MHMFENYGDRFDYSRGHCIDIENLNYVGPAKDKKLMKQLFQVDGEVLEFKENIHIEVVPEALDIVCDFERLMQESG